MLFRILEYFASNPIETKLVSIVTLGTIVAPVDIVLKFILPLASAVTWYFLKPQLDKWRKRKQERDKLKKE